MREIVFDTETTGFEPLKGDRVVEIGCVELINLIPTGQTFHRYLNPERDMPDAAFRVHGLSTDFLKDKPKFAEVVDEFLEFIGDAKLVAHNASFDLGFLNAELQRQQYDALDPERIIDTLVIARRKNPFGPNSLDALCQRYNIDNSRRAKHGALLDAEILAEVYIELMGGRQADLGLADISSAKAERSGGTIKKGAVRQRPTPLKDRLTEEDIAAHLAFVRDLNTDVLWSDYIRDGKPD